MTSLDDGKLEKDALHSAAVYDVLVERYDRPLCPYLHRFARNTFEDVKDLEQGTYLKLHDFDQCRALAPLPIRIAHNSAVKLRGKRWKGPPVFGGAGTKLLKQRNVGMASKQWAARARWNEAHTGPFRLAPRHRETLALRHLEEKSCRDIGDILRPPSGIVATLIHHSLAQLRGAVSTHSNVEKIGAE